jgi:hypothetical protein
MGMDPKFVERRKEPRLPYIEKIIFTDGEKTLTAPAANLSRGGIFAMTLDPFPIDTMGYVSFIVQNHPVSLCIKAKVAHIVFDQQRCEVECGMGLQFLELSKSHQSIINLNIVNEQHAYLELRELLKEPRPDFQAVMRIKKQLPWLQAYDLLSLRYRVNRICTIFDSMAKNANNKVASGS